MEHHGQRSGFLSAPSCHLRVIVAGFIFIIFSMLSVFIFDETAWAARWGKIMYPPLKANIRAMRTTNARLTGQLQAGERIRADFLKDSWYALGYVYAPLLQDPALPATPKYEPLEGPSPPLATHKENPPETKIIVAINNASLLENRFTSMNLRGQLVKSVTGEWNHEDQTARIWLLMDPRRNYFVRPLFYEKVNTFCLEIMEERQQPPDPSR